MEIVFGTVLLSSFSCRAARLLLYFVSFIIWFLISLYTICARVLVVCLDENRRFLLLFSVTLYFFLLMKGSPTTVLFSLFYVWDSSLGLVGN